MSDDGQTERSFSNWRQTKRFQLEKSPAISTYLVSECERAFGVLRLFGAGRGPVQNGVDEQRVARDALHRQHQETAHVETLAQRGRLELRQHADERTVVRPAQAHNQR